MYNLDMEALRYKPTGFWILDDTAPFQDYSGYSRSGTLSGTESHGIPLTSDALYSQVFNNTVTAMFPANVYVAGRESNPFTLAATVYPVSKTKGYVATPPVYRENLMPNSAPLSAFGVGIVGGQPGDLTYGVDASTPSGRTVIKTSTATGTAAFGLGSFTDILAPGVYSAGYMVKSNKDVTYVNYSVQGTATEGVVGDSTVSLTANVWRTIKCQIEISVEGNIQLGGYVSTPVAIGDTITYSSFLVEKVSNSYGPYFDGDTPGYEWAGVRGQSSSRTTMADRTNLANNPSFETDLNSWAAVASATLSRVGTNATNGSWAMEVGLTAANQSGAQTTISGIVPNTQYSASIDVTGVSGDMANVSLRVADAAGTRASVVTGLTVGATNRYYITWTSAANATTANFFVWRGGAATAVGVIRVDSLMVESGFHKGGYFDGSTLGYQWTGTANASPSIKVPGLARINLATNPSIEAATGGGYSNSSARYPISIDNTKARVGTQSARSTRQPAQATSPRTIMDAYNIGMAVTAIQKCAPGETMTVSAYMTTPFTGYQAAVGFSFYNSTGGAVSSAVGNSVLLDSDWDRPFLTTVVPAGAVGFRTTAEVYKTSTTDVAADGDYVNVDCVLVEKGSTLGEYFDGSMLGSSWRGTVNGSESYGVASNNPQQILSSLDRYDGLTIDGTEISFSTKYVKTGEAKCTYDMQVLQKAEIVGVHTSAKNSLYVNGVAVAEVDITPEQQLDAYDSPNSNLYTGKSASSQGVLVNNLITYPRALHTEEITAIYNANNRRATGNVPKMFDGEDILIGSTVRPAFLSTGWSSDEDWNNASKDLVAVEGGQLVPQMQNGVSLAGTWTDSIDLYTGDTPVNIDSMNLFWYGSGETVEASIDGENWVVVNKGENLSIIPQGFDPTNKALYIKVSFAAGLTDSYVDSMRVRGYTSSTALSNGRVVSYSNPAVVMDEYAPAILRDDWGVTLGPGGTVVIGADTSENPSNPLTVEVWFKTNSGSIAVSPAGTGTTYINGGAYDTPRVGEWTVMHSVHTTPLTGTLSIAGDVVVGKVVYYSAALTATQVAAIVANYTGVNTVTYDGTGSLTITEPASSATVYAHDWAISAA